MKTLAIGFALLVLTTTAMADHNDYRRGDRNSGAIAWSTRDRDGNRFSIVFQFGDRTGVDLRYEQGYDRYDRYDRYGRYDRYDHYDRYDRYDRYGRNDRYGCPPVYDYGRYRGREYDRRYFDSFEHWTDWRQWQKHWSKRRNWQRDDRERHRAWVAFCDERSRAYDRWSRSHRDDDYRYRRSRDDDDD